MKIHCVKSVYGVFSGPYFPAFGLNMERYSVKIRTRRNSVFAHFSRSDFNSQMTPKTDWTTSRNFNSTKKKHFQLPQSLIKFFKWKTFCLRTTNYQSIRKLAIPCSNSKWFQVFLWSEKLQTISGNFRNRGKFQTVKDLKQISSNSVIIRGP